MQVNTTAAGVATLHYLKRSAANTGGTATNPAGVPLDANDAAASGVLSVYTAAPTTGTLAGKLFIQSQGTVAATSAPAFFGFSTGGAPGLATMVADLRKPIILRGVAQSFCVNFDGAALPAGFSAIWTIEWVEY
jgi:hypothetical protein